MADVAPPLYTFKAFTNVYVSLLIFFQVLSVCTSINHLEKEKPKSDEGPGDDPWTPTWFWKNRSSVPPPEAKTRLSIDDLKHLPNFYVTGAESTGTSAMISMLGRSQQIIQTGESCYFAFDQEIEEHPLFLGKYVAENYRSLEKIRKCLYLDQDPYNGECIKIRQDYVGNKSLIDVTIGSNKSVAPAFSEVDTNMCEDTSVKLRSEKCPLYLDRPFAVFHMLRHSALDMKLLIMVRNPIARACSRYAIDHRGLKINSGENNPILFEMQLVRDYRTCRATQLLKYMCSPEAPFLSECDGVDTSFSSGVDTQLRFVNLEKKFTEILYNYSPEQVALKNRIKQSGGKYVPSRNDVHLYTFSEMEKIEWNLLFRCFRPMFSIPRTFYPALYAEHIQRIVAVFEAYDLEFKDSIYKSLKILEKFDPTFSASSFPSSSSSCASSPPSTGSADSCVNDAADPLGDDYKGVRRLHDRILIVHNEELYDNPEVVLERVLKFANLDPSCLHEKKSQGSGSSSAGKERGRGDVEVASSSEKSKKFEVTFASTLEEPHAQILRETQQAAGGKGKLSALEYAQKRCSTSSVEPWLLAHVYKPSIQKFEKMFGEGIDFEWESAVV